MTGMKAECKEKFRIGEKTMDAHGEKLDWIMQRANHILLTLLMAIIATCTSVWVAQKPDPALARIEKIVMERFTPTPIVGLPNDSTLYDIMREDNDGAF